MATDSGETTADYSHSDNEFVVDVPITNTTDDEFGHREYVDVLEEIINRNNTQQNIGIFGTWGTGKSSVVQMLLRDRFSHPLPFDGESESDVPDPDLDSSTATIYFNAWEHAEGSLRTELLLSITQQLAAYTNDLDDDETDDPKTLHSKRDILTELYDVIERPNEEPKPFRESFKEFASQNKSTAGVLIAAVFGLLATIGLLAAGEQSLGSITGVAGSAVGILTLGYYLTSKVDETMSEVSHHQNAPRKEWSGSYGDLFEHQLNAVVESDDNDIERFVIAIDDLDRCESDVVYETFVGLKTFLQNDRCTYIIPCDKRALEDHVTSLGEGEYFDQREGQQNFLEKFFDIEIQIPQFRQDDLNAYAKELNKQLSDDAKLKERTLEILAFSSRRTPRRIVRSINRVQSLLLTADELESKSSDATHIPEGTITKNEEFLAKTLVIEQDFPDVYETFQENPELYELTLQYFDDSAELSTESINTVRRLFRTHGFELGNQSRLERFFEEYPERVSDTRPFVQLGQPTGRFTARAQFEQLLLEDPSAARDRVQNPAIDTQRLETYADVLIEHIRGTTDETGNEEPLKPRERASRLRTVEWVVLEFPIDQRTRIATAFGEVVLENPNILSHIDLSDISYIIAHANEDVSSDLVQLTFDHEFSTEFDFAAPVTEFYTLFCLGQGEYDLQEYSAPFIDELRTWAKLDGEPMNKHVRLAAMIYESDPEGDGIPEGIAPVLEAAVQAAIQRPEAGILEVLLPMVHDWEPRLDTEVRGRIVTDLIETVPDREELAKDAKPARLVGIASIIGQFEGSVEPEVRDRIRNTATSYFERRSGTQTNLESLKTWALPAIRLVLWTYRNEAPASDSAIIELKTELEQSSPSKTTQKCYREIIRWAATYDVNMFETSSEVQRIASDIFRIDHSDGNTLNPRGVIDWPAFYRDIVSVAETSEDSSVLNAALTAPSEWPDSWATDYQQLSEAWYSELRHHNLDGVNIPELLELLITQPQPDDDAAEELMVYLVNQMSGRYIPERVMDHTSLSRSRIPQPVLAALDAGGDSNE